MSTTIDTTGLATRPLRADAKRNRAALLAAAEAAFAERGVAASLEEIALIAGVGIGTLYRHFPTRQDLVESLIHDRSLDMIRLGAELLDADDAFAALETWLQALVKHAASFRGLAESMIDAACDSDTPGPLTDTCEQQQQAAAALVARAQAAGQVRADVTTDDVLDLTSSIAWVSERRGHSATRLLAIALDGLRV
jgi:AcrR family transcriptional regulator